ncbi:MAG: hypothetical protein COW93_03335, partial [Parcubacteria group bacterium CG22_combo_CG10-13_8_21_14_all_41_9]
FTGNKYGFLGVGGLMSPENLLFSGNSFFDNTDAGFFYAGDDLAVLDLRDNWWGSSTGPTHADNPGGNGDVIESNYVLFSPWLVANPALPQNIAPVLSFIDDEGYVDDGVSPDVSFIGSDVPIFQIAFSDADGDSAEFVRLVVGDDVYSMATSASSTFEFVPPAGVFGKGAYEYHFEASDGVSSVRLPVEGELEFEVRNVPVVLVPGIMGTDLWKGDDLIWPDIVEMGRDIGDDFMNVLVMDSSGFPTDSEITTGDAVRAAPTKNIFEGLINDFSDAGYSENTDLFVFPYDWRLDIRTSAQSLKDKIDSILNETGSQKIDVMAHSMGGLLAKQYVLNNGSSSLGKLIFVGTPHLGAPKAAKTLLFGDNLGIALIFSALSSSRIQYISQNMPSIYELLPSESYVSSVGSYYGELGNVGYDYAQTSAYLASHELNTILLDSAEDFHSSELDDFDASGVDAYNINGCTTPTISSIIKRNDSFSGSEYSLTLSAGDGTVPIGSSNAIQVDADKVFYFKTGWLFNSVDHSEMPSTDGIRELIISIITGNEITLPDNATQDSSQCVVAGKLVSVHSPVNLHIYDSEGNHVGRGENGDIEYDISGVAYEEIGENKFVFLPESGGEEYRVELDGTDSGTFSLRVSKVENNEITETAYYSDIPVNSSSEATITLSESVSSTVLEVDQAGTGNFETVSVASVLNSEQSSDTTKPITSISTTGGTTSAIFTLSGTDDNSGILKIEYSTDSGATWQNYSGSVIINTIGETEVLCRSKDRAGNLEDYKSETIRVSSAAVILTPLMSNRGASADKNASEEKNSRNIDKKVLGAKIERSRDEQYSDADILNALSSADIETIMDYLGQARNPSLEKSISIQYANGLDLTQAEINFISYGTKSTKSLGTGERAGVIHSFKQAFGRLPKTNDDWNDVLRIATNQAPIQRNSEAEQRAKDAGAETEQDMLMVAYGIRPKDRDLQKEIQGIAEFVKKYGHVPSSTLDWNILRSIVYK